MPDSLKNYEAPVSITFSSTLVVNGVTITVTSPLVIQARGYYDAWVDGVLVQFAVVDSPRISYVGLGFPEADAPFWRAAQQAMPDEKIYDHALNAYPYFNLPVYEIQYFVDQPCFVSLYVDDQYRGRGVAKHSGRNSISGVGLTRGRHKIEFRVEVEP